MGATRQRQPVYAAQIAVALGVVHAAADDKFVAYVEAAGENRQIERPCRWLAQQRADREARATQSGNRPGKPLCLAPVITKPESDPPHCVALSAPGLPQGPP